MWKEVIQIIIIINIIKTKTLEAITITIAIILNFRAIIIGIINGIQTNIKILTMFLITNHLLINLQIISLLITSLLLINLLIYSQHIISLLRIHLFIMDNL
jgi:hypothetical protein